MKLIAGPENFELRLRRVEKDLLLQILSLYPRRPEYFCPISRSPLENIKDAEALLCESLAEQRAHNRRKLEELIKTQFSIAQDKKSHALVLNPSDREWLLEILNDVRVGTWYKLGAPDQNQQRDLLENDDLAQDAWIMELCAYFQSALLNPASAKTE